MASGLRPSSTFMDGSRPTNTASTKSWICSRCTMERLRVSASTGSGVGLVKALHDLFGLVLTPACPVGVSLLSVAGGVEVTEFVVVDDGRAPIPVHGYRGREARIGGRRRHDGTQSAACELQDGYSCVFDFDPLVGEQACVGCYFDHGTHQPLQEVDAMDGLVDQNSPTVEFPGPAPAARVVVRLRPPPPDLGRP